MKKLFAIFVFCCFLVNCNYSQTTDQHNFTVRMNNHLTRFFENDYNMVKAKELYGHTCDKHHIVTEEEIKANAAEAEKHAFIQANMEEYMKLYFPEQNLRSASTTVEICDNGGFEQDFLHYTGYRAQFSSGSTTCNPIWQGAPSVFTQIPMPSPKEFEIMSPGIDPITGIQRVKFGQKSLKINDPFLHPNGGCGGSFGINRLKKEFLVTSENREFTVWYSVAVENPANHNNQSPFLSIICDLAPFTDLCFDSDILDCDSLYSQPGCGNNNLMDVLDWTCHRIKIPKSQIGNIATLEITMADCGQSAHNGYAYLDGICESANCTGGPLGSVTLTEQSPMVNGIGIDYVSCNADKARVCGSYTDPTLCGTWQLDSIVVPGFPISNVSIDTINKRFCFDININDLGSGSSAEIFVAAYFKKNGGGYLPVVFSNSINLYKNLFTQLHYVDFEVSQCYDNGSISNISDDYYFVNVRLNVAGGNTAWSISKTLLNPYPGESGYTYLDDGFGSTNLVLGPFYIQEGSWKMTVTIGNCVYEYIINPPPFCPSCAQMSGAIISNITCIPGVQDQWSFTLSFTNVIGIGGTYDIYQNSIYIGSGNYNTPYTVTNTLEQTCVDFEIRDVVTPTCFFTFTVCPPLPCSEINCALDVKYKVRCLTDAPGSPYEVLLDISNNGPGTACVVSPNTYGGGGSTYNGSMGPFTSNNVTIVIFTCPNGGCSCTKPTCFKVIKIFKPKCSDRHFLFANNPTPNQRPTLGDNFDMVYVKPNPINHNELKVVSKLALTKIMVSGVDGRLIHNYTFTTPNYTWDMDGHPAGIYILQYLDDHQKMHSIKFVKN